MDRGDGVEVAGVTAGKGFRGFIGTADRRPLPGAGAEVEAHRPFADRGQSEVGMRPVGFEEGVADRAGAGFVYGPWWGWFSRFWWCPAASLVFEHGSFAEAVVGIGLIKAVPPPKVISCVPGSPPEFDLEARDAEALRETLSFEGKTVDAFLAIDPPGEGEGDSVGVGADAGRFARLWPQVEEAEAPRLPAIGGAGQGDHADLGLERAALSREAFLVGGVAWRGEIFGTTALERTQEAEARIFDQPLRQIDPQVLQVSFAVGDSRFAG